MNWVRPIMLAAPLLLLAGAGHALTQVSGPVQIGPSTADGHDQDHGATLSTTITNQGGLPDRLVNVACPGYGTVSLTNGHVQPVPDLKREDVQRNGLDLPASLDGRATPVQAQFALSQATQPMVVGALIPCALYFQHAGQRVVVFSLGTHETSADIP